MVERLLSASR